MICPNCGKLVNEDINFCPFCGKKLFEDGVNYLIQIVCGGQRSDNVGALMVFVDDKQLYEVKPGESIFFNARAGYHSLKFRHRVRNKTIQLPLDSNYQIKASYNSLSGLIETGIARLDEDKCEKEGIDLKGAAIATPIMVSKNGAKGFDIMLGEDDPEYEIKGSSGLKEGVLRLYSERCEFDFDNGLQKEIVNYKDIESVKKKMGSIDLICVGNVHKIYSIPKDIYNEVMAFLTKRIEKVHEPK